MTTTQLSKDLSTVADVLGAAAAIPGPVGDVAAVLAAAARIAVGLAGDGRTVQEIVAHIERADDIAPKVAAGDKAAADVVRERFGAAAGDHGPAPTPAGNTATTPEPVDRSARAVVGTAIAPGQADVSLDPNGQQKGYVVLTDAERAKGFVRPVRRTYVHLTCDTPTTMGDRIAETYARDPGFYSGTFCVACKAHFPVGADGEFVWPDGSKVGT